MISKNSSYFKIKFLKSALGTLSSGLIILISHVSSAQNIVIDPSLEDTLKCPASVGRFYSPTNPGQRYIADWRATTRASPDLHNTCGYNNYVPHTGEGYAGIILWDPAETREYISASFSSPMEAGVCYYVELYVALNDNCTRTIEEFQFSFSATNPVDFTWPPPAPLNIPIHYQLDTPVTSNTWEKRSFFYQANGGEEWVTLGNFVDNTSTTISQVSNIGSVSAYYFIDDLTITKLDIGPDVTLCPPDSAQFISNIDCPSLTYTWSNGDSAPVTTTSTQGTLTLTVSGNGSCSAMDDVTISLPSGGGIDAGQDITIDAGNSADLLVTGTTNPTWSPGTFLDCNNCVNPIATPPSTQTYTVTGPDVNGCMGTDSITVFVIEPNDPDPDPNPNPDPDDPIVPVEPENPEEPGEEVYFYLPNSFTPDGDEFNNAFRVVGGSFSEFELKIWDRWGQTVFISRDPNVGWNGINADGIIKQDTYIYKISVVTTSNVHSQWTGHVNVLQ